MNRFSLLFFVLIFSVAAGCNLSKRGAQTVDKEIEFRQLDTMQITAPRTSTEVEPNYELPVYRATATRASDLLHTRLELSFDWQKEQVIGQATLTLRPFFYASDKVVLDAKGFEFNKVALANTGQELEYEYDGLQIEIQLDRTYTREESYHLLIDYVATPRGSGGSSAISSDKGLYFINPRGEEPGKPSQIWTQGETESNSRWFPTIDKPNERCTQEIFVTVSDTLKTLSNGLLISSTENGDGTRTDYWKMDLPHAPYLFMLAIGDYSIVEDSWNNMLVDYYVEHEYEPYAKRIFPHTVEMLGFFSEILGYEYPWAKYSQVVVRDYVSGAMENTTAVIFGEFMYGTDRDLVDRMTNDLIVAHEMMHHWFGDLVTCESWANLTLNEGFANYSEYLWMEHKYGLDDAEYHRLGEGQGYFGSTRRSGVHPLIHFGYEDKEDMFDAHSYNKGGLVLHMLRQLTGDEAFFASLTRYLKDNAYTEVEGHELRLAFEAVTGNDWNWFFNQWFYAAGHPILNIDYDFNEAEGVATVRVEQLQDPATSLPVFVLPTAIDIVMPNGEKTRHEVVVNQREQVFTFEVTGAPAYIQFDADRNLLAERDEVKSAEMYAAQYRNSRQFLDRFDALQALAAGKSDFARAIFEEALNDNSHALRKMAAAQVEPTPQVLGKLRELALRDPHSSVRIAALDRLSELEDEQLKPLLVRAIQEDFAYSVVGTALELLVYEDVPMALQYASDLESEPSENLLNVIGNVYVEAGDPANLPFFEKRFDKAQFFGAIDFFSGYATLAAQGDVPTVLDALGKLQMIGTSETESLWRRFGATAGVNNLHAGVYSRMMNAEGDQALSEQLEELDNTILAVLEIIKNAETDKQLKALYKRFPDPNPEP